MTCSSRSVDGKIDDDEKRRINTLFCLMKQLIAYAGADSFTHYSHFTYFVYSHTHTKHCIIDCGAKWRRRTIMPMMMPALNSIAKLCTCNSFRFFSGCRFVRTQYFSIWCDASDERVKQKRNRWKSVHVEWQIANNNVANNLTIFHVFPLFYCLLLYWCTAQIVERKKMQTRVCNSFTTEWMCNQKEANLNKKCERKQQKRNKKSQSEIEMKKIWESENKMRFISNVDRITTIQRIYIDCRRATPKKNNTEINSKSHLQSTEMN